MNIFTIVGSIIVLFVLFIANVSTIPAGHVGVKVNLYGSDKGVSEVELPVGRYFIGFGQQLYDYPVFTQNDTWAKTDSRDQSISFQTKQGLSVNTDLGISYHIDPKKVSTVFQKYRKGNEEISDIVLRNMVQDALVKQASKADIESVYGEGKTKLLEEVQEKVTNEVADTGIIIEHLYWTGTFRLPAAITKAIDDKIAASQKALLRENEIAQTKAEAQKAIEASKGEAEAKITIAKAEADAIRIHGEAEAAAIEAKSHALNTNPQLVQYEIAQHWNGVLPTTTFGANSIPMINIPH